MPEIDFPTPPAPTPARRRLQRFRVRARLREGPPRDGRGLRLRGAARLRRPDQRPLPQGHDDRLPARRRRNRLQVLEPEGRRHLRLRLVVRGLAGERRRYAGGGTCTSGDRGRVPCGRSRSLGEGPDRARSFPPGVWRSSRECRQLRGVPVRGCHPNMVPFAMQRAEDESVASGQRQHGRISDHSLK